MKIAEVSVLHPNLKYGVSDFEFDEPVDESYSEGFVPAFIQRRKFNKIIDSEEVPIKELDISNVLIQSKVMVPRYQLNIDEKSVVVMSSELLDDLSLIISYKNILGIRKTNSYDEALAYNDEFKNEFSSLITKRDGYLIDQNDYLEVDKGLLSEGTQATTLKNYRVILFWRGIRLREVTKKKLLSLGLSFLIGGITYAELFFYVRRMIPNIVCEVSIKHKEKSYVLIGLEAPIFS